MFFQLEQLKCGWTLLLAAGVGLAGDLMVAPAAVVLAARWRFSVPCESRLAWRP
jgi:hypothetical protein